MKKRIISLALITIMICILLSFSNTANADTVQLTGVTWRILGIIRGGQPVAQEEWGIYGDMKLVFSSNGACQYKVVINGSVRTGVSSWHVENSLIYMPELNILNGMGESSSTIAINSNGTLGLMLWNPLTICNFIAQDPIVTPTPTPTLGPQVVYSGDCGADGSNAYWTLDSEGKLEITGNGPIASYTDGYPPWYKYRKSISVSKVVIGSGITDIGAFAFTDLEQMTSITLPNTLKTIGYAALSGCKALKSISLPSSLEEIYSSAFGYCQGLTNISLGSNIKYVCLGEGDDSSAFYSCDNLTSITVANSNTVYASYDGVMYSKNYSTLLKCPEGKSSVKFANNVSTLYDKCFMSCEKMTNIIIPNSVTSIGYAAFMYSGLKSVTIPNSVEYIGDYAFRGCWTLSSISLSSNLHSIGQFSFDSCGFSSITIPYGVVEIGPYAFSNCSNLTSVSVPNSLNSIGDYAFSFCSKLTSITLPNTITEIGEYAFSYCMSLTDFIIPESISMISMSTFSGCNNLESVTIPYSVTSIGDYAFIYCDKLTDVYYGRTKSKWDKLSIGTGNTCLTNANIHYTIALNNVLTLPTGLTTIDTLAFANLPDVDAISIPSSVTEIDDHAFDGSDIVIICPAGSYAATWADAHGILWLEH
ncbi:MAG: leucine-rich repeat domain-containing protein [Clostridia bacterium]|nr:leucine-rich repeat domain-containing protein [Clostridia bacterium]